MPITINGSGTVTGISVGGLPDGIVDNDMLAANAVTSAKITAGTIASGDLASGVGGKILQIVSHHSTGGDENNSDGHKFQEKAITTTTNSSKVLILWQGSIMNKDNHGSIRIYRGGTSGTEMTRCSMGYDNNNWDHGNDNTNFGAQGMNYLDTPGNAGTYTYSVHGYVGGTYTMYWNRNPNNYASNRANSSLTLMEIAV